jgi:hypothetical protein
MKKYFLFFVGYDIQLYNEPYIGQGRPNTEDLKGVKNLSKETMEYGLDTFEDGDHVGGILCTACDWDDYVEITEVEYDFLKKKRAKDWKAYLKYKAEQALNCRPPINRY